MKIYINDAHEIKAIHKTSYPQLKEIEVDRESVFGDMSDFMILGYCYKQQGDGFSIYPYLEYEKMADDDYKAKVRLLEASQKIQDDEILANMLATTEVFELVIYMSTTSKLAKYNLGGNNMVEVYVTLILKGAKTIEQVPAIIRQQVQEQLDLLTK